MMWWSGSDSGGWGWWWPVLFMAVWLAMMLRMMRHGSHGSHSAERHGGGPGGAEGILADRLARGDIDIDEYERRLSVLRDRSPVVTR